MSNQVTLKNKASGNTFKITSVTYIGKHLFARGVHTSKARRSITLLSMKMLSSDDSEWEVQDDGH